MIVLVNRCFHLLFGSVNVKGTAVSNQIQVTLVYARVLPKRTNMGKTDTVPRGK